MQRIQKITLGEMPEPALPGSLFTVPITSAHIPSSSTPAARVTTFVCPIWSRNLPVRSGQVAEAKVLAEFDATVAAMWARVRELIGRT